MDFFSVSTMGWMLCQNVWYTELRLQQKHGFYHPMNQWTINKLMLFKKICYISQPWCLWKVSKDRLPTQKKKTLVNHQRSYGYSTSKLALGGYPNMTIMTTWPTLIDHDYQTIVRHWSHVLFESQNLVPQISIHESIWKLSTSTLAIQNCSYKSI